MVGLRHGHPARLSQVRIFWFWLPLAAMWFMMAVEQPLVAGFIARMAHPELNLAAYGVVFAVALLIESPIIMLLMAGTALSKGADSYRRLLRFSHALIGGLTIVHLLIAATPLYDLILGRVIGAPAEVVRISRGAFLAVTPWTAAVGYRRLWQGVLIRYHKTAVVPVTIAVRFLVTALLLAAGFSIRRLSGVLVGSAAVSVGSAAAAAAAWAFAAPIIKRQMQEGGAEVNPLSRGELLRFYLPLAMTSLILIAARPILTTALSRLPQPLSSLALWPVLLSVVFLGRSIATSFQEAAVALLQDRACLPALRRFVRTLAACLLVLFGLFTTTPLARIWFGRVAGLSAELAAAALLPLAVLAPQPALSALISWQRGILAAARHTAPITRSVAVNLAVLIAVMLALACTRRLSGVLIASAAYTISVVAEWLYLRRAAAGAERLLFR